MPEPHDPRVAALIRELGLHPLPGEGGLFAETYRSSGLIPARALADRAQDARNFCTAIYYLVTPDDFSTLHRVASTEIFHFYRGDPMRMIQITSDGRGRSIAIGADVEHGERPQVVVPRGVWQGARLLPGGRYALLGCTVSPGFDFADYEQGRRDALTALCPDFAADIAALTPE